MELYRALYAFYHQLVSRECDHSRVQLGQNHAFCPDCGYKITLQWTLLKCRQCDSKRVPKKTPDGRIVPLHKYCRHCGSSDSRLVKRERIDAYDLLYAISTKEIDYSEERKPAWERPVTAQPSARAPQSLDIVEGQVIRKRYVSQNTASAWEEAPFNWQGKGAGDSNRFRQIS